MLRKTSFIALSLLIFAAGCASKKPEGKPVARFGGETVTDVDFIRKADSLPRELRAAAFRKRDQFLEDLVGERFLLQEARKRKLDQEPEVADLIEQARNKILVAKLIQLEVDNKLQMDSEEAQRFYDLHKDEFLTPLMLRASHILVKTREEADAIKADLDAGGDFEEAARRKSIDPTGMRGGDLGFFQKGQFVPEFEQAVFSMSKGEVRGPVQTQFGWHIIKLTDRVEPSQRSFDAVKSRIQERLILEKRSQDFRSYLQKLKGNVKVDVDQKALEAIQPDEAKKTDA
jgi:peptidyl-prolyl cis-trans isomerase C